jgi:hypothetical protein
MPAKTNVHRKPAVGDKVGRVGSDCVYEVTHVNDEGTESNLCLEGTNLERFRVPVSLLTFPAKARKKAS